MNGVIPSAVRLETAVSTAILGQSNNFIPRYTSQPNVTTFKTPAIVQGVHSVHLLMLNVSDVIFLEFFGHFLHFDNFESKFLTQKCIDIQNATYCPRGAFCAFAYVESKTFSICTLLFMKSGIFCHFRVF